MSTLQLGSHFLGDHSYTFTLWAPLLKQAAVHLVAPEERLIPTARPTVLIRLPTVNRKGCMAHREWWITLSPGATPAGDRRRWNSG